MTYINVQYKWGKLIFCNWCVKCSHNRGVQRSKPKNKLQFRSTCARERGFKSPRQNNDVTYFCFSKIVCMTFNNVQYTQGKINFCHWCVNCSHNGGGDESNSHTNKPQETITPPRERSYKSGRQNICSHTWGISNYVRW